MVIHQIIGIPHINIRFMTMPHRKQQFGWELPARPSHGGFGNIEVLLGISSEHEQFGHLEVSPKSSTFVWDGIFHEINHPFVGIPRTQDFDLFLFWVKSPSMIGGSPTCGMVNRLVSVFIITHLSVPFDY